MARYKLVYNKKGRIYGSYSGIPGKKDVFVIERDVLEGRKQPHDGVLKITENGEYDTYAYGSVDVQVDGGESPKDAAEVDPKRHYIIFGSNTKVEDASSLSLADKKLKVISTSKNCIIEGNILNLGLISEDAISEDMNDFVSAIQIRANKTAEVYEINDARLPETSDESVNKLFKVDIDGNIILSNKYAR